MMPVNTVYVGRGSKFGNPFKVTEDRSAADAVLAFELWLTLDHCSAGIPEVKKTLLENIKQLKGKNLACWCRLDQPCHADVLLEMANAGEK